MYVKKKKCHRILKNKDSLKIVKPGFFALFMWSRI